MLSGCLRWEKRPSNMTTQNNKNSWWLFRRKICNWKMQEKKYKKDGSNTTDLLLLSIQKSTVNWEREKNLSLTTQFGITDLMNAKKNNNNKLSPLCLWCCSASQPHCFATIFSLFCGKKCLKKIASQGCITYLFWCIQLIDLLRVSLQVNSYLAAE